MSGGDYGRNSDSTREGIGVNDYAVKQINLLQQCLNELRIIRAQIECVVTEEIIDIEDLDYGNH